MTKAPKVVAIDLSECRLVAADESTHRVIVSIGGERFALDFSTRITCLPLETGDCPAEIIAVNRCKRPRPDKPAQ